MPQALTVAELDALASRLQVGATRRIQAELEIDHVVGAVPPAVTPGIVQTGTLLGGTIAGGATMTMPGAVTPGNILVAVVRQRQNWTGAVVPPNTNGSQANFGTGAWTSIAGPARDKDYPPDPFHGDSGIEIFGKVADSASSTCHFYAYQDAVVYELEGVTLAGAIDISSELQSGTTMDVGSLGSPAAGLLAFMGVSVNCADGVASGWTPDADWTLDLEFHGTSFSSDRPFWMGHSVGDGTALEATIDFGSGQLWGGVAVLLAASDSGTPASLATARFQVETMSIDRSRKMQAAQLDASLPNELGDLGYYTGVDGLVNPNNQLRAYAWHGDRANRVRLDTGLLDRDTEHRDPRTVALKARSRLKLLLEPHRFVAIASQVAGETGAIRTEENGVFLNRSPEYIAAAILDMAGWPADDRSIATSGIVIPEYDLSDQGAWVDQLSGTDRLTAIAGWDLVEDELGILTLGPNDLAAAEEPDADWTFEAGVNVIALDHQVDDEERSTRVRVSGPMTSSVPKWSEEWATTVIRDPVGLAFNPSDPDYLYAIDWKTQYLSKLKLSTRKVVARWYLGGSLNYFPGGLCFDTVTGDFFVLDTNWVHGANTHAQVVRLDGPTKAHVATYALPDGQWSAIKTDGANLWLTNYGDDKLYKRSMTAVAVSSTTITDLSGDLQHNPTGLWIDGTTIGVFFEGIERFLLVDSSAPGVVTGSQSTKGTQITGGEKNTVTGDELYADRYDSTSGHIWAFDLADDVTTDVVKWAIDYDLEDALGFQAGVADRVHEDCPNSDDPHPYEIRIATVELRTINDPDQAQAVANYQLVLRKRLRRTLDLLVVGHPGIQVKDWIRYIDVIAGIDSKWMVDTKRDVLLKSGPWTTQMSVLPWEAAA